MSLTLTFYPTKQQVSRISQEARITGESCLLAYEFYPPVIFSLSSHFSPRRSFVSAWSFSIAIFSLHYISEKIYIYMYSRDPSRSYSFVLSRSSDTLLSSPFNHAFRLWNRACKTISCGFRAQHFRKQYQKEVLINCTFIASAQE